MKRYLGLTLILIFGISSGSMCQKMMQEIIFPDDTKILKTNDGYEFTLPSDYEMINADFSTNVFRKTTKGKIKCECEKGEGNCSPSYAQGTIGCYTYTDNPCKECKATVTSSEATQSLTGSTIFFKSKPIKESGIAYFSSIYPAENIESWINEKWIDDSYFQRNERKFEELYELAYDEYVKGEKIVTALMISEGGKFIMDVPMRTIGGGTIYAGTFGNASKFSCFGCDDTCVLKRKKVVIRYCDGCVSSCTLSFP